ncbi:hypothetical protein BO71DRAFT_328363 [Aspergillus ellipticus CBS 707.79]|uniref:Rhodopsin domain-containing protein n=1 Tax=Aspergillus ellipticus CBS 707.79 TaxID=1448320 RepID=A0A319D6N4_9EURO|nr:hypothetical protein BO71DRAFT_328363 [Aspergillus ellipticus CBS 707.79]
MAITYHGTQVLICVGVFTVLTTVVLGLRLWAIHVLKKRLHLHDIFVSIAYISTCILSGLTCHAAAHGLGKHTRDLSATESAIQHQFIISGAVTSITSTVGCKLSILALYSTLFQASRLMRILIWLSTALVTAYFIVFLCLFLTQCQPLSHYWNPTSPGSCRFFKTEELLLTGFNILIDTLIALLPAPTIWTLQMSIRNKWMVSSMFYMGLLIVALMAWRLKITYDTYTTSDWSYAFALAVLLMLLELWLSIIIVSIPSLVPLVRHFIEPRSGYRVSPMLRQAQYMFSHRSMRRRPLPDDDWDMDEILPRTNASENVDSSAGGNLDSPSVSVNKVHVDGVQMKLGGSGVASSSHASSTLN